MNKILSCFFYIKVDNRIKHIYLVNLIYPLYNCLLIFIRRLHTVKHLLADTHKVLLTFFKQ